MNASGPISGLSPRAERLIRVLSTVTVLCLAIAAAILSFSGLQQLSLKAGISHSIAWLLPVVIDGLVLTGSLGVVSSSLVGMRTWYSWTLTILGVIASVAGNVAIAHPTLSSRLVHSAGPLTFALSIEGLLRIYRSSALATAHRERAKIAKEEADLEKQARREEREARKEAKLLEAISHSSTSTSTSTSISIPAFTPAVIPSVALTSGIEPPSIQTPVSDIVTISSTITHKAGTTKEKVAALLNTEPDITGAEVARRLDLDDSYARKTLRDIKKEREIASIKENLVEDIQQVKGIEVQEVEKITLEEKKLEIIKESLDIDPFA